MTSLDQVSPADGAVSVPLGGLRLQVSWPRPGTAVLTARGDLDMATAARFTEVLHNRLRCGHRRVVVDLSELNFFGTAGIAALVAAELFARHRGTELIVHTGTNRAVTRVLAATGAGEHVRIASPATDSTGDRGGNPAAAR